MDEQGSSSSGQSAGQGPDPLASLHRMSTTAGAASQDYVAINLFAILSAIGGVLSALVFVSLLFLIIPAVTLLLGFVSLRQIGHSSGTQTGRIGSWLGILLALGLSGVLTFNVVRDYREASANRRQVLALCDSLEQALVSKKYDAAYAMFSDRFKSDKKLTQESFVFRLDHLAPPSMGALASVKSNGLVSWLGGDPSGLTFARTMLIFKWSKSKEEARFEVTFVQMPQHGWQVMDLPTLFPTPQDSGAGGGPAGPGPR